MVSLRDKIGFIIRPKNESPVNYITTWIITTLPKFWSEKSTYSLIIMRMIMKSNMGLNNSNSRFFCEKQFLKNKIYWYNILEWSTEYKLN